MNIVDSSGWLEYFAGSINADNYIEPIEDKAHLIIPSLVVFEVSKKITLERGAIEVEKALDVLRDGL